MKPYACPHCLQQFTQKHSRDRHVQAKQGKCRGRDSGRKMKRDSTSTTTTTTTPSPPRRSRKWSKKRKRTKSQQSPKLKRAKKEIKYDHDEPLRDITNHGVGDTEDTAAKQEGFRAFEGADGELSDGKSIKIEPENDDFAFHQFMSKRASFWSDKERESRNGRKWRKRSGGDAVRRNLKSEFNAVSEESCDSLITQTSAMTHTAVHALCGEDQPIDIIEAVDTEPAPPPPAAVAVSEGDDAAFGIPFGPQLDDDLPPAIEVDIDWKANDRVHGHADSAMPGLSAFDFAPNLDLRSGGVAGSGPPDLRDDDVTHFLDRLLSQQGGAQSDGRDCALNPLPPLPVPVPAPCSAPPPPAVCSSAIPQIPPLPPLCALNAVPEPLTLPLPPPSLKALFPGNLALNGLNGLNGLNPLCSPSTPHTPRGLSSVDPLSASLYPSSSPMLLSRSSSLCPATPIPAEHFYEFPEFGNFRGVRGAAPSPYSPLHRARGLPLAPNVNVRGVRGLRRRRSSIYNVSARSLGNWQSVGRDDVERGGGGGVEEMEETKDRKWESTLIVDQPDDVDLDLERETMKTLPPLEREEVRW